MQALFTVGGGIVGGMFGMPQLGQMAGSLIGGLLFPQKLPDVVGPRLGDLKVTVSTSGNMIYTLYGSMRTSGNVIYSTPKIETENTEVLGGKGGPTQNSTTYTYSQSFAVALCEGEIVGVTKIFANGKLIYNTRNNAPTSTIIASSELAAAIRVYRGTADQMPDPFIEADQGIDKTSAYRGTAYIFFEGFQLGDYGNTLPNLEFEVVRAGTNQGRTEVITTVTSDINLNISDPVTQTAWITESNAGVLTAQKFRQFEQNQLVPETAKFDISDLISSQSNLGTSRCQNRKMDNDSYIFFVQRGNPGAKYFFRINTTGEIEDLNEKLGTGDDDLNAGFREPIIVEKFKKLFLYRRRLTAGIDYTMSVVPYSTDGINIKQQSFEQIQDFDISPNFLYVLNATNVVKKYTHDLVYVSDVITLTSANNIAVVSDNEIYVSGQPLASSDRGFFEVSTGVAIPKLITGSIPSLSSALYYNNNNFYGSTSGVFRFYGQGIEVLDVPLSDIVTDLCLKSGLTIDDIDVTQLETTMVHGYCLTRRDSLRSSLEPLMQSYFFDAVESDGKLKFVKRGGAVAAVLERDDLGAHEYNTEMPDNVKIERKQEVDLPREVTVTYLDKDGQYQPATQYTRRQNTAAVNSVTIELPLVLSADESKVISDVLLYDYWQSRNLITIQIGSKYAYLEPTDIIQFYKNDDLYTGRIIDIEEQNNMYKVTLVTEDTTKYTQEAVGQPLPPTNEQVSTIGPTNLQMLDIPLMRDQDDKQGFYFAARGYLSGWTGAAIFKSNDNGISYVQTLSTQKRANIGFTNTNLGNFSGGNVSGGNVFDETNIFEVTCYDELSSISRLAVLNGGNFALVGNEIIQYRDAVLIAENRYRIYGLLRGRRGTEWRQGQHVVNERFVVLNEDTINLYPADTSEYDLSRVYKAVTFRSNLANAIRVDFTNTGMAQECYSPVLLGGGRDSSNNYLLQWTRRGRINNGWNNKINVLLGEETEAYEIDILNGTTVVRTLTSTTPSVSYTSAQQITDFGVNQSTITFVVYQMSSLRGRGIPAQKTI